MVSTPFKDMNGSQGKDNALNGKKNGRGCISATRHASAYQSIALLPEAGMIDEPGLQSFQHVNCSYLSSGPAPTLLELKQHAQALCNLIHRLCVPAGLDQGKSGFVHNDAFDFLNDLDTPYTNEDESHHVPLSNLRNQRRETLARDVKIECPWAQVEAEKRTETPFLHHQSLLEHANECLLTLDNEYADTGGILSILPRDDDSNEKPDLANVRNSFIGQWLLHYQHLVARTHELEISHLNALDLLAGEASFPSKLPTTEAGVGVETQDRFILANAGDDVASSLHDLLDREDARGQDRQVQWSKSGVTGNRLWKTGPGGEEFTRRLVSVDVKSRFYRHAGVGRTSPIFVIPAHGDHPGIEYTRQVEHTPAAIVLPSRGMVPFPELPNEKQLRSDNVTRVHERRQSRPKKS